MIKMDKKRQYFLMAMVFLLMVGGVYRMWPQIENIFAVDDTIVIKKKRLIKYQKMVHGAGNLEKELKLLEAALKRGETGLLTGKTPALAAADIQKVVKEIAKKSQVEIQSVRVLKPKEVVGSPYLSIPVQVVIKGVMRHLTQFLYQIMQSPKYLTVQQVRINVTRRRMRGKAKVSELIKADITINGFIKSSDEPTK
jgi:Tfp pilus assembly protein PilO